MTTRLATTPDNQPAEVSQFPEAGGGRPPGYRLRSSFCATIVEMSPALPPVSLRLGDEGVRALDELARRRRVTRAEAARQAITETAARERRRAGLAAEAAALMADPQYVAEAREVAALMEQLRGPR